MRNPLGYLFAFLLSFTLISCGDNGGGDRPDGSSGGDIDDSEIRIGHFASLQGDNATFGQQTDKGMQLAADEINAAGGVLGKKIKLITEDTRSVAQDAGMAAEKLIGSDDVHVLVGEVASSLSLVAAPIAEREGVPMVSPASTNPKVTVNADGSVKKNIFRICFIDPFQGKVMAKFATEHLKAKKVAVLTDNASDYSVGLANNFKETFTAMGGEIVEEQAYEAKQVDFKSQLTAIKNAEPQAIFIPGYYNEVSLIAEQARALGITVPLLGGDGWDSPELTKGKFAQALEGSFFSNHYSVEDTAAKVQDFKNKYSAKYGEDPGAMSALGYDALYIIADAIKRAGKVDRAAISKALAETKGFVGVTGTTTINAEHNADKPAVVLQIKGGKFTYFSTVSP